MMPAYPLVSLRDCSWVSNERQISIEWLRLCDSSESVLATPNIIILYHHQKSFSGLPFQSR